MEIENTASSEMQLRIGIAAAPAFSFNSGNNAASAQPVLPRINDRFRINVEAAVPYSSLSRVFQGLLAGKRFDISEGLIATHIIVQRAAVQADVEGNLLIQVQFTGSFGGTVHLKGKPIYDATTQTIQVANTAYELQSGSFLLQTAKWLFNNKISEELKKHTRISLTPYLDKAKTAIDGILNKEWTENISGKGTATDLRLEEVAALPGYLSIKGNCDGKLVIEVSNFEFKMPG